MATEEKLAPQVQALAEQVGVVILGIDALHREAERHWTTLCAMQTQQVIKADLDTLAQQQREVVDAVHTLHAVPPVRRRRPWWLTPGLCTLALCGGVLLGWEALRWRAVQVLVFPPQAQQVAPLLPSTQKRGR